MAVFGPSVRDCVSGDTYTVIILKVGPYPFATISLHTMCHVHDQVNAVRGR